MNRGRGPRRVLVLQHVPWESPGRILPALERVGAAVETRMLVDEPDPRVPPLDDLAGIVLMGGPMGADDIERYPALALERDLVGRAVEADIPVLGVCLGHQILAIALGGTLESDATREVGVAPVSIVADSLLGEAGGHLPVLHWHFDNVTPPPGSVVLARTDGCPNQAFQSGSAFGMQFHLEVDAPLLATWLATEGMGHQVQAHELTSALAAADARLGEVADAVFGHFASAVQGRR
jgi:GMP synthase (glutamine-hydrolysing)